MILLRNGEAKFQEIVGFVLRLPGGFKNCPALHRMAPLGLGFPCMFYEVRPRKDHRGRRSDFPDTLPFGRCAMAGRTR